jgi:hypothetical protein
VLLVHGLAGNHDSPYVSRIAAKLNSLGFPAIRMDQRGCGAGRTCAREIYHAARSLDLLSVLKDIHDRHPRRRVTVCGFSLGGNATLRLLGQYWDQIPANVDSAIVVAPPADLAACVAVIRRGFNLVYDQFFVRRLWKDYQARRKLGVIRDVGVHRRPRSIFEFDQRVTAPLAGFDSAEAYYAAASSTPLLSELRIPTLLITARDDSLIPHEILGSISWPDAVTWHVVEQGGHLGFVSDRPVQLPSTVQAEGQADRRWLDWRIVDAVAHFDEHPG